MKMYPDHLKQEITEIKKLVKEVGDTKANKWVEDGFRYALYTVAGIIIVALMGVILIKSKTAL